MGQREIHILLKQHKEWMTSNEIKDCFSENSSSVCHALRKMRQHGEVEYEFNGKSYTYKYKKIKTVEEILND